MQGVSTTGFRPGRIVPDVASTFYRRDALTPGAAERQNLLRAIEVGVVAYDSHAVRPDNATRAALYRYLRGLGYRAMDALRWAYGPPKLPAIEWLEFMGLGPYE